MSSNINLDRSFFVVVSSFEKGGLVQREMELEWDRDTVLQMAREGQFDEVVSIIETNPVEGWSNIIPASEIEDEIAARSHSASVRRPRDPFREHRLGREQSGDWMGRIS